MLDYLQKYKKLPESVRAKLSSSEVMSEIDRLEKEYSVDLATVVVRLAIDDLDFTRLPSYFLLNCDMTGELAKTLSDEIKDKTLGGILRSVKDITQSAPRTPTVSDKLHKTEEMISGSRQSDKRSTANFFFSPEDEEEVKMLAKNAAGADASGAETRHLERLGQIIREAKISFSSSFMEERFRHIILTYLRGVRNLIETRQTLIKPFAAGGLGIAEAAAEKIVAIITKAPASVERSRTQVSSVVKVAEDALIALDDRQNPDKKKIDVMAEIQKTSARDIEYDLAAEISKKKIGDKPKDGFSDDPMLRLAEIEKSGKILVDGNHVGKLDLTHELAPLPPAVKTVKPVAAKTEIGVRVEGAPRQAEGSIDRPDIMEAKARFDKLRPRQEPMSARPMSSDGKYKMEDVKYVPFIVDAIGELRYLSLVNFRRLSPNPKEAIAKIKDKLSALEKEKYARRLEGIKAWRQSPTNRVYLDLGQECISNGLTIEAAIEKRKKSGSDYLDLPEFEAIMDLNRELRY